MPDMTEASSHSPDAAPSGAAPAHAVPFHAQDMVSLFAALRACDTAVIRCTSEESMFEAVCQHLMECRELSFAWIGRIDAQDQQVWPQAQCGRDGRAPDLMGACETGVLEVTKVLAERTIATDSMHVIADVLNAPALQGHTQMLDSLEWRSAFAFPLRIHSQALGALCVYGRRPVPPQGKVPDLLAQLAANISHALETLDREEQRQETLRALRESESRYSAVFASNGMPMLLIDPDDGRIVDANERAQQFYGWDHSTLLGMNIEQINVLSRAEIQAEMARAVQADRSYFEFRHRRAAGDVRSVEVFSNPFEVDGRIYLISSIQDVTQRRELQAQLHDTQMLMQRFVDHLPGVAFIKDSSLRLKMANQELGRVLGRSPQSLIGLTVHDLYPQEIADFATGLDREVLAEGGVHVFEESLGSRHNETSMFVMEDDAGQRLLGGVSFDVTERYLASQRAQAMLRLHTLGSELSEKEFMTVGLEEMERLTHSAIGFLHWVHEDQNTLELVTWTSKAMQQCQAVQETHKPVAEAGVWAEAVRRRSSLIVNDYAAYPVRKGLPTGHTPLRRVACVPVQEGGKVRMVIGVGNKDEDYGDFDLETLQLLGNDLWRIVQRNRVEIALQQQIKELVAVNQKLADMQLQLLQSEKMASIGQLAAGVAHEINNPVGFVKSNLSSLSNYLEQLLQVLQAYEQVQASQGPAQAALYAPVQACKQAVDYDFLLEDLKQLIVESTEGVHRIGHIVADLKNFSRTSEAKREWTDVHAGIESTINVVWNQLKYKVELRREFGVLPQVRCIASQINQVVMNLLVNAGQAISERGHITVRTGVEGDSVWIEVQDDGCGMSAEVQQKVFEPFFTTKPVGQGTGLGLSISFGIVQRHHGSITLRSAPGQGSTFRVTLPIDAPEEVSA